MADKETVLLMAEVLRHCGTVVAGQDQALSKTALKKKKLKVHANYVNKKKKKLLTT
jgi:hypothetical protein